MPARSDDVRLAMGSLQPVINEFYALNKNQVFFTHNAKESAGWDPTFVGVATAKNLRPVFWAGAGRSIHNSNQMQEITADCYNSSTIVIYVGSPRDNSDQEDLWVLRWLSDLIKIGRKLVVYSSESYPTDILTRYGYTGPVRRINDEAGFRIALEGDLNET